MTVVSNPFSASMDVIAAARRCMSEGRLDEADLLLDEALAAEPGNVEAQSLRAAVVLARGQSERATVMFSDLATRYPDNPDIVADLGAAHLVEGRLQEARFCLERAISLRPGEGRHRASLIGILISLGDIPAAKAQLPDLFDLAKRTDEAGLLAEAYSLSGRAAAVDGALFTAEAALREALALRPGHKADLRVLSDLAALLNRSEEALALAQEAYLQAPADHDVAATLAGRLIEANRLEEAERHLRRTLATAPYHVEANYRLAVVLIHRGEGARALTQFAAVVRRSSESTSVVLLMARLVRATGDLTKALSFVDLALKQAPGMPEALSLREHILLALGRVAEVWPAKDMSGPAPTAVTVPLAMPVGEVMLFMRFARRLVPEGERIVCHAEPALLPLLAGVSGIITTSEPATPGAVPIMSLPALMGAGEDFSATPYLAVEEDRYARWREATAHLPRPLIGLFWDEASPGLTLDILVKAASQGLEGQGTLISLVFDTRRTQLSAHPAIVDAGAYFSDARDMVGAIAQLDLTIGSDGGAVHVAGALGRPGIVAVAAYLPWMWAAQDGKALWYPTIQVARQPGPGAWDGVLGALTAAAREAAARANGERAGGEEA